MGWSVPDEKREEFSGRVTGNSELSFQGACDSPGEDPTALLNGCPQEIASARRIEVNQDRKSTRLNSSHTVISYAVFCLKKKHHEEHRSDEQRLRDQREPRQRCTQCE